MSMIHTSILQTIGNTPNNLASHFFALSVSTILAIRIS